MPHKLLFVLLLSLIFVVNSFGTPNLNGVEQIDITLNQKFIDIIKESPDNKVYEHQTKRIVNNKMIQKILLQFFTFSDRILIDEYRHQRSSYISCGFSIWPVGQKHYYFLHYERNVDSTFRMYRTNSINGFEKMVGFSDYYGDTIVEIPSRDCQIILNSYQSSEIIYSYSKKEILKTLYYGLCGVS